MGNKINVAEILKDKPQGTKLNDLLRNIDVELDKVDTTDFGTYIECTSTNEVGSTLMFDYSKLGTEKCWFDGLQILLPSKEMRDWSKFAWKRGDVLISDCGFVCIFKEWASDDYTRFNGCYFDGMPNAQTAKYSKLDNNTAYGYIRELEKRCGGVLNIKTLKIEKPEFKDGDIVAVDLDRKNIRIFKEKKNGNNICWGKYYIGFSFNNEGKLIQTFKNYTADCSSDRLATDSEKQQLFSALEKEGKAWDSNKKSIVDLKPKVEFKPMDLCLMKYIGQYNNRGWELCQYAYTEHRVSSSGEQRDFYHAVGGEIYAECIPYNEDTKHLLGTRDKWKGGEG